MKTCLVVDDSSVIRKVARRILEGLDFQIVEAEDGEKALEVCKRGLPEAILLDWNMPIMDGLKLVKRVRSDPTHKAVPIIVITTEGSNEDRQRALSLGANAYITKPIQAPQVIAKVKELLKIEA